MNIYKKRIERLMKERGMSNKTLSNKLGVSQSYVSQILSEKQYRGIGRNTLVKLANIFHVPVDVLLSDEEPIVSLAKREPHKIPLLPWIGLNSVTLSTFEHIALKAQEFISYDCANSCFAVRMPFKDNAIAIVDIIADAPKDGDVVLVESEGDIKVGRINFSEDLVILSTPEKAEILKKNYRVIGKVISEIVKYD